MIKLSDYVIKFLEDKNVKNVFILSGGGCMHLVDSLGKSKIIQHICCHHEQACAMACEAASKFTGELSVSIITSGPAATNTITGVVGAYQDSAPCLFISGQSKRQQTVMNSNLPELRQFGVQEVNIIPIVESITKFAVMVNEPEKIRYYLEKAVYLAMNGRPGPVWLDIPLDVQGINIDEKSLIGFNPVELEKSYKIEASEREITDIVCLLKKAKRPVIIAGHGIRIANACNELKIFIEKYNIPVVTPIMGIDVLETEHKNYIGRIGTKGWRSGNFAMQNADLILSIGSRLAVSVVGHEYKLFAREAKIVVVDIDKQEHKKQTIKIDEFINADAKIFLSQMLNFFEKNNLNTSSTWLKKCQQWKNKYPICLPEYKKNKDVVNFYSFVDVLTKKLKGDIPVISDAGSAFYVVSQTINVKKDQRYITSGGLATMGFSLPAAIGVCIENENKPVVAITGDGSFQQNIQEIQTMIHYKLPIKLFVINNNGYLSIRQTQKKFFNCNFVGESKISGVSFPETKKIANAYGVKYVFIENNNALTKKLNTVLNYDGPVICEIKSSENLEVIPTNSAAINKDGIMISKPLEDMFPFLDREKFYEEMIVKPIEDRVPSLDKKEFYKEMLIKSTEE
jgi:acetolactate synthase-1/2/3 large subunit